MRKKVSVIMAAYNCADTVRASLDSIINQTFKDWELIVCDDGSSDNTYEILKEYEQKYPEKIIVIQNKKNSKLPFSLNHCLKYATGEYIARMDADDMSYEDRLRRQVQYLDENIDIDVVGTGMTCFNENGITGTRRAPKDPNRSLIGPGVPFFHATIMMRKTVYDRLNGYSLEPYVLRCEDVDLWIRFFAAGYKGANLQDALYYVREDITAVKRRNWNNAINASKTLFLGFSRNHYPLKQYIYVLKPLISVAVPKGLKYFINRQRWKNK